MRKIKFLVLGLLIFGCTEKEDPNSQLPENPEFGEIADIEGNKYKTVKIGSQIWMTENLRVTKFSNGDNIPNVSNNKDWENIKSPGWSYQNNNQLNDAIHGKLYNWYVANDSRNCCPQGWRVPDENDFGLLANFLGGETIAGGKLKQTGNLTWFPPNTGATNETGFNGLPSAYRYEFGRFDDLGYGGGFWIKNSIVKWYVLKYDNTKFEMTDFGTKNSGISIRCIKAQ